MELAFISRSWFEENGEKVNIANCKRKRREMEEEEVDRGREWDFV